MHNQADIDAIKEWLAAMPPSVHEMFTDPLTKDRLRKLGNEFQRKSFDPVGPQSIADKFHRHRAVVRYLEMI